MKRPRLPRFISGGPRQSGFSRADLGTTPCAGNAHPKKSDGPSRPHPKRFWMGLDGLWAPIVTARRLPHPSPSKPIQAHRPSNRDLDGRFWPLWETPDFPSKRALDGLVGPTRSSDSHTERAVEPLLSSSSEAVQQHHRLIGSAWFSARSRPYLTVAPVSAAPGKHCRPP